MRFVWTLVKKLHLLGRYCEERPLLLGNVGMGARLSTYYRKVTPTDSTAATLRNERGSSVGVPLPLEPTEDSPFLGDIRPGDTQSCLETNMYRAPAFHHKVAHTDFLLVRSAKGKLSLRRIDSIHVIGQQVISCPKLPRSLCMWVCTFLYCTSFTSKLCSWCVELRFVSFRGTFIKVVLNALWIWHFGNGAVFLFEDLSG